MSIKSFNQNELTFKVLELHQILDGALWQIEDNLNISTDLITKISQVYNRAVSSFEEISNRLEFPHENNIGSFPENSCLPTHAHLKAKIQRLEKKLFPHNSNQAQFLNLANPSVSSSISNRQIKSFSITSLSKTEQTAPSISSVLNRVSYLLRHEKEADALNEFNQLPKEVKGAIYGALWIVRGRPTDQNPIAHLNFGEVSFYNQEKRCYSTPKQKACAVELFKTQASIREMIALFEQNNSADAIKIFHTLPPQIQNEIYGMHWIACGKPTPDSKDDYLRSIAHIDFGKVSFLGLEERCNVGPEKSRIS